MNFNGEIKKRMSLNIFTDGFVRTRNTSMRTKLLAYFFTFFLTFLSCSAYAQFEVPEFEKISKNQSTVVLDDISLTGEGLYENTALDSRQTNEIRARLQAAFGDPTRTLEDLVNKANFRPGKAIQFEYWFMVNDSIPMVVLDWDGPFGSGLTFGGASKYVDLMPQIKRTFAQKLMSVDTLANYKDYFYSPERKQWYVVRYKNGDFNTMKIESPDGMSIDFN